MRSNCHYVVHNGLVEMLGVLLNCLVCCTHSAGNNGNRSLTSVFVRL